MGLGSSRAPHLIPSNEKNASANLQRKHSSPQKIPVFEGENKLTEPIPITSPVGSPSQSQSLPNQPLFDCNTLHSPNGIGSQHGTVPTIFRWTGGGQEVFLALLGPVAHGRVVSSFSASDSSQQLESLNMRNTTFNNNTHHQETTSSATPNNTNNKSLTSLLSEVLKEESERRVSTTIQNSKNRSENETISSSSHTTMLSSTTDTTPTLLSQSDVPWSDWIPMVFSDSEHLLIHNLHPGVYLYRFRVDGRVRHDPNQRAAPLMHYLSTQPPITSYVNVMEVHPLTSDYNKTEIISTSPSESYTQVDIDFEVTPAPLHTSNPTQQTPSAHSTPSTTHPLTGPLELPVYLERALLNTQQTRAWRLTSSTYRSGSSPLSSSSSSLSPPASSPPPLDTTESLPLPHHVMLNHLYARTLSPDVRVLGLSVRYKQKFVTVVFYTPTTSTGVSDTTLTSESDLTTLSLSFPHSTDYSSLDSFHSRNLPDNELDSDLSELSG